LELSSTAYTLSVNGKIELRNHLNRMEENSILKNKKGVALAAVWHT
jgi:hypothetical protein